MSFPSVSVFDRRCALMVSSIVSRSRVRATGWLYVVAVLFGALDGRSAEAAPQVPEIAGEWRHIAGNPDLGELGSDAQEPVDFGIWQADDGTWQLWSCIRKTKESGKTRLFHRWEASNFHDPQWRPMGIAMRAEPKYGETPGGMQAPYVFRHAGRPVMFYGDWVNICRADSDDGKRFVRYIKSDGRTGLFSEGAEANARDPMIIRAGERWICYYTAHPGGKGAVYARTSSDLINWSESRIVAHGAPGPDERFAAECPFVAEPRPGEYYLFYTQAYGRNLRTTVLFSRDPLDFGGEAIKERIVTQLPVAAPEVFQVEGEWFIASVRRQYDGIEVAPLRWASRAE